MALSSSISLLLPLSLLAFLINNKISLAGDPDIISDFTIPQNNNTTINGSFFTYTGLRGLLIHPQTSFKTTKVTMLEFPALNGLSISYALFQFPSGTINPPHTHPRASELLFLLHGSLQVGVVDTKLNLYKQTLEAGDMFIFPKGLIHYQYNPHVVHATAISAFGSANAGTVSVPISLFGSGIDEEVLAKSFKIDVFYCEEIIDSVKKS
ncbi:germin-like protein 9-3 [Prosopis cineraria]|uniref:germin-like protein 9-3 n=1 Tax=Prosopis cineraria TaxID=364024 RepID=UPI00240EA864|nr:germin-like protein 9-3 [Prosopis cineraria]